MLGGVVVVDGLVDLLQWIVRLRGLRRCQTHGSQSRHHLRHRRGKDRGGGEEVIQTVQGYGDHRGRRHGVARKGERLQELVAPEDVVVGGGGWSRGRGRGGGCGGCCCGVGGSGGYLIALADFSSVSGSKLSQFHDATFCTDLHMILVDVVGGRAGGSGEVAEEGLDVPHEIHRYSVGGKD